MLCAVNQPLPPDNKCLDLDYFPVSWHAVGPHKKHLTQNDTWVTFREKKVFDVLGVSLVVLKAKTQRRIIEIYR